MEYLNDLLHLPNQNQNQLYSPSVRKHKEFVVFFKKLFGTYIYTYISDMRTEHLNKT